MSLCLTFDVEAWPVPADFGVPYGGDTVSLSCDGLSLVLDLLKRRNVHATFFVCGDVIFQAGALVKRALRDGHEIAFHGNAHLDYTRMKPAIFAKDTARSMEFFKSEFGVTLAGFRAPRCRINKAMFIALQKLGFVYDSSIHPTYIPKTYNYLGFPSRPFRVSPNLLELPISVGVLNVPISWWWFRNIGRVWSSANARHLLGLGQNAILYFHPWEFVKMPVLAGVPLHMYRNSGSVLSVELEKFICSFPSAGFTTMRSLVNSAPIC